MPEPVGFGRNAAATTSGFDVVVDLHLVAAPLVVIAAHDGDGLLQALSWPKSRRQNACGPDPSTRHARSIRGPRARPAATASRNAGTRNASSSPPMSRMVVTPPASTAAPNRSATRARAYPTAPAVMNLPWTSTVAVRLPGPVWRRTDRYRHDRPIANQDGRIRDRRRVRSGDHGRADERGRCRRAPHGLAFSHAAASAPSDRRRPSARTRREDAQSPVRMRTSNGKLPAQVVEADHHVSRRIDERRFPSPEDAVEGQLFPRPPGAGTRTRGARRCGAAPAALGVTPAGLANPDDTGRLRIDLGRLAVRVPVLNQGFLLTDRRVGVDEGKMAGCRSRRRVRPSGRERGSGAACG